jgi:stage V sporulation protein SpoVS
MKNIFSLYIGLFLLAVIQNQRNKTEVQAIVKTIINHPIKDNTADAILAKKKFLFCVTITFAILPIPVG